MAKHKSGPSGPTKTYDERSAKGVPINGWLPRDVAARLAGLAAMMGKSKIEVIETLIIGADISELTRFASPNDDEAIRPEAPPGSPADLAARVRAKGARREAIEVSTGKRVREGRTER